METYFLTYADSKFRKFQELDETFAKEEGFDHVISKTKEDILNSDLYENYSHIIDYKPGYGDGYFLWKPYIILETLKSMNNGDVLVYSDCGDKLSHGIKDFVIDQIKPIGYILIKNYHLHSTWTKRDCFYYMNCDSPEYWNSRQLEAGFVAFIKNNENIKFVEEWLNYSKDENIIVTKENVCGLNNLPGYADHRHDQSILTNLCIKYKMRTIDINFVSGKLIYYNYYKV